MTWKTWNESRLCLVGDLFPALVPARRFRILVLVIELLLQLLLLFGCLGGVLGRGRRIVAVCHG